MKFPADSKDLIESLFASHILKDFPYYGRFWEYFIGYDKKQKVLRPYALQFLKRMKKQEQNFVTKKQEQISTHHYSMFCELSGAHFQLEKASDALKESDNAKRHFLFWEAFGNFYMHIGNAMFQLRNLWEGTRKLLYLPPTNTLKKFLSAKPSLAKLYDDVYKNAIRIRNSLVHYARNAYVYINGKYFIPLPIQNNPKLKAMLNAKKFKETCKKMQSDLKATETLLNNVMPLIRNKIYLHFSKKRITIVR